MATQVDERVVSMKFDNADFERRSSETLKSLQQLDNATSKLDGAKGLEGLASAAKQVDLSHIEKQANSLQIKFSALQIIAVTTLQRITNSAITTGENLVKSLTIQPVTTGFNEYELKMGSIQTIMAGTGESIETVNKYLEELNAYSDRTIYSFSDMTQNIGKFTNAGVKLDKAVAAIKGVSNVAALSGANSNEASRAMYNFAQALSAGHVKLMDWKSIELANMATVGFKNQLLDTAVELGTVTKTADGMYKTLKGKVFSATKNFNEVLSDQWMTTDVLIETLSDYADETTEIGKKAYASAQDVKTFTMLLDTLKEAAQSGWAMTYELIIGNFEEAKALWTSVNNVVSGIISESAKERNAMLKEWRDLGGRDSAIKAFSAAWDALLSVVKPVRDAIREVFPSTTGKQLYDATEAVRKFMEGLELSEEAGEGLKQIIKILLLPVKTFLSLFQSGLKTIFQITSSIWNFVDSLLAASSKTDVIKNGLEKIFGSDRYSKVAESLSKIITKIRNSIALLKETIFGIKVDSSNSLPSFLSNIANIAFDGLIKGLETLSNIDIEGIIQSIISAFNSLDITKLFGFIFAGGAIDLQKNISNFVKGITDAIKPIDAFKDILSGISDSINAFATKTKYDGFLKAAGAIAILTASLVILASIKTDKLTNAVMIISVLFYELTASLNAISLTGRIKQSFSLGILSATLISLSSAVLILSAAMKLLSSINLEELVPSLIAIVVMCKTLGSTISSLSGSRAIKGASGIIAFAIAIRVLSSSVLALASIPLENLVKGIVGVLALLGGLSFVLSKANFKSFGVTTGLGLIELAAAFLILSSSIEKIGQMPLNTIAIGIGAIAASLTVIVGAVNFIPKGMMAKATGFAILSVSLLEIGKTVSELGKLSWDELAVGLTALAGALTVICIAVNVAKGAIGGAVALTILSSSLFSIASVLKILGGLSLTEVGIALLSIAGTFTVLGLTATVLAPFTSSILALSGALALFGIGIVAIGGGILALSVGLTGLAASGAVGLAALGSIITMVIGFIPQIVAAVAQGIVLVLTTIASSTESLIMVISSLILAVCQAINDCAPDLVTIVAELILLLLSKLAEYLPDMMDAASNLIVAFLEGLARNSEKLIKAGISTITSFLKGIASQIGEVVDAAFDVIFSLIDAMIEAIEDYTPKLISKVFELGGAIIDGIIKGIFDSLIVIKNSITKVGETILNGIREFFGIHSPSVLMRDEVGRYIVQGIAEGITSDMSAEEAAEKKGENIKKAFQYGLDKVSLNMKTDDLELQLWKAMNPDASEEDIKNQEQEKLKKDLANQADKVNALNAQYATFKKEFGYNAQQTQEAYNSYIEEKVNFIETASKLMESLGTSEEQSTARMVYFAQELAANQQNLLDAGFTMEQIKKAIAERTGYNLNGAAKGLEDGFDSLESIMAKYLVDADVTIQNSVANSVSQGFVKGSEQASVSNLSSAKQVTDSYISDIEQSINNGDWSGVTGALSGNIQKSVNEAIPNLGVQVSNDEISKVGEYLANQINQAFQTEAGINSPSKVMYQNGVWLVEGLANGINASAPLAYDAMARLVNGSAANYSNAGAGLVDGMSNGVTNGEVNTLGTMADFFKKSLAQVDANQPIFYNAGNNLTKRLCDGMTDGFTTYFDAVTNAITAALTQLETEVKMRAASITQSVQQALSQASQIGVSGTLTPVVYAGQTTQQAGGVAKASIKVPAYKKNYTTALAKSTQNIISGVTGGGAIGAVVRAVGGMAAGTVINNFTQNNTSPKALSRTEIYRDSKNLFSRATGGSTKTGGGRK